MTAHDDRMPLRTTVTATGAIDHAAVERQARERRREALAQIVAAAFGRLRAALRSRLGGGCYERPQRC